MKFLTTLLIATALCAGMLAVAAHRAGDVPELERWAVSPGAEAMIGTSGSPDAVAAHDRNPDQATLDWMSVEVSRSVLSAVEAESGLG